MPLSAHWGKFLDKDVLSPQDFRLRFVDENNDELEDYDGFKESTKPLLLRIIALEEYIFQQVDRINSIKSSVSDLEKQAIDVPINNEKFAAVPEFEQHDIEKDWTNHILKGDVVKLMIWIARAAQQNEDTAPKGCCFYPFLCLVTYITVIT